MVINLHRLSPHIIHCMIFLVPSLSLSQLWQVDDKVMGVVNVLLPWNHLFNDVSELLANRPSSYLFTLTRNGMFDELHVYHFCIMISHYRHIIVS